jgi:hypothetical protein
VIGDGARSADLADLRHRVASSAVHVRQGTLAVTLGRRDGHGVGVADVGETVGVAVGLGVAVGVVVGLRVAVGVVVGLGVAVGRGVGVAERVGRVFGTGPGG